MLRRFYWPVTWVKSGGKFFYELLHGQTHALWMEAEVAQREAAGVESISPEGRPQDNAWYRTGEVLTFVGSDSTLKKYRLKGDWIEGIHWVRINSRCVRYNLELIQDWLHNRGNPNAHLKAIQIYQQGLLSNQRRKR